MYRSAQGGFLSNIPSGVKYLLSINIIVYILQIITSGQVGINVTGLFSLNFLAVFNYLFVWQIFTYMFLHGGEMHLLFNMLGLFMLGIPLESYWGTRRFIYFYLFSGLIAGILIFSIDLVKFEILQSSAMQMPTVGASGAIFGLLLAYGLYYPDRKILVFFVFPVKIKDFILWTIILSIIFIPLGAFSFISHTGHLGGILGGYIYHRLNRSDYHFNTGNSTLDSFFFILKSRITFKQTSNVYSINQSNIWSRLKNIFSFNRQNSKKQSTYGDKKFNNLDETKMTDYEIESKIDELLDKISSNGLRGLTMEEQLFLDRVSYLYRHKFPS